MNIIELAREAGLHVPYWNEEQDPKKDPPRWTMVGPLPPLLERFAALVRARALEEAAGVCENTLAHHYMKQVIPTHDEALLLAACADCADAIRALKEQT